MKKHTHETQLGTRCEIKNLNSFRFLEQAITFEAQRQIELIEDGGRVRQETRLYDPDAGQTRTMRSKEDSHDYRYFPDPDLPPLRVDESWIARVKQSMPALPASIAARLVAQHGLSQSDAACLTQSKEHVRFFEAALCHAAPQLPSQPLAKGIANWMNGELAGNLNRDEIALADAPLSSEQLGQLVVRILDNTLSSKTAKEVFAALWKQNSRDASAVDQIIESRGLKQLNDDTALQGIVAEVIAANPALVNDYRAGKTKAFQALVGQVMKATQGKANPQQVNALLQAKL